MSAAKNMDKKLFVEFKHFPHENVEFLGEEDFINRVGEVRLGGGGGGGRGGKRGHTV